MVPHERYSITGWLFLLEICLLGGGAGWHNWGRQGPLIRLLPCITPLFHLQSFHSRLTSKACERSQKIKHIFHSSRLIVLLKWNCLLGRRLSHVNIATLLISKKLTGYCKQLYSTTGLNYSTLHSSWQETKAQCENVCQWIFILFSNSGVV